MKSGHANLFRVAVLFCSEDFGKLLQDSISIVRILDVKFAFPRTGLSH
jgi:hypothetical protein